MKKQQTPVVLIALLVVFGGAMIAMRQRPANEAPTDPSLEKGVTGKTREGVTSKDLAKTMEQQVKPKAAPMRGPDDAEARSDPAILLPDVAEYIPTPNSTSTSSQWFKDGKKKDSN